MTQTQVKIRFVGVVPVIYRRVTAWLDEYEWLIHGVAFVALVLALVLAVIRHLP